jgi:hypothetical protein
MTTSPQTWPEEEPQVAAPRRLESPDCLELLEALRRENDQLRTALASRIVIEQAKGMLAERLQVEVGESFERLRREARNRRMKLHALAAAVVAREAWTGPIFRAGGPVDATRLRAVQTGVVSSLPAANASEQTS